jgi:uncharacterized damage-inducible protein DinB
MVALKVIEAEEILREQLLALLDGSNAHMPFDMVVAEMPIEAANLKPDNFNYSPWHLLEHMRRAQEDILQFIKDPDYASPPYDEFWPAVGDKADESRWRQSVAEFRAGLDAAMAMITSPTTDFYGPIPHAPDYTVIREILLIADHNAYHLGEMITMRQILGVPPPDKW